MAAIRYSKQREAIRMYLLSTKSHPTAEAVYNNIKNEHPRLPQSESAGGAGRGVASGLW